MLSAGMLTDLASAMIVRSRGLLSASPPPFRAATVSSLMMRVNALPRFASAAPFLCLIVCHFEWPDMAKTPANTGKSGPGILPRGPIRPGFLSGAERERESPRHPREDPTLGRDNPPEVR